MGVSGSGKTTVGQLLAEELGARFVDADSLHPQANVAKMAAGEPLRDEDRQPWLKVVGQQLATAKGASLVMACSALKKAYRDVIRAGDPSARFVLLHGNEALLSERLAARKGHFMPASLLRSQLDNLEPLHASEAGITLDIADPPERLARRAAGLLLQLD